MNQARGTASVCCEGSSPFLYGHMDHKGERGLGHSGPHPCTLPKSGDPPAPGPWDGVYSQSTQPPPGVTQEPLGEERPPSSRLFASSGSFST